MVCESHWTSGGKTVVTRTGKEQKLGKAVVAGANLVFQDNDLIQYIKLFLVVIQCLFCFK